MQDDQREPRIEGAQLVVDSQGEAAVYDAKFLISILLVYVAKGDGEIDPSETDRMIDIVSRRFDSSSAEAMGLLSDAVRTFTEGGELVDKLRIISKDLSEAERKDIFNMLLDVITADGELADGEIRTVEFAGKILGLSEDAIHAGIRSAR